MDAIPPGQASQPPLVPSNRRNHYIYIALGIVHNVVQQRHPILRLPLPERPTLSSLLNMLATALKFDTEPVHIPRDSLLPESKRRALRALALESAPAPRDDQETQTHTAAKRDGSTILTHGLLQSAPPLKPLAPDQRARFKENFADVLNARPQDPYFLVYPTLEAKIPTVECKLTLSAIDHEDHLPEFQLFKTKALWDTGAELTFITDDCLSDDFSNYLKTHPVHDAYRYPEHTRVQLTCLIEFSNHTLLQIETVAMVVSKTSVPNKRSGVILGQKGLIDSLCYHSIPRKVAVAKDPTFPEDRWGRFDIQSYCEADGSITHYD